MRKGKVDVDNRIIDVNYKFINDVTIFCVSKTGYEFYTHYKSLVVN